MADGADGWDDGIPPDVQQHLDRLHALVALSATDREWRAARGLAILWAAQREGLFTEDPVERALYDAIIARAKVRSGHSSEVEGREAAYHYTLQALDEMRAERPRLRGEIYIHAVTGDNADSRGTST